MNEVLLGRPFFKEIGLNLHQHLKEVREIVHNQDICNIKTGNAKLSAMHYSGLAY